jgi:ParB family chromosome partitioning protein
MAKLKGLGRGLDALFSASNVTAASIVNSSTHNSNIHANNANNNDGNNNIHNHDKNSNENDSNSDNVGGRLQYIALEEIKSSRYQPRKFFDKDELQELADSIVHNGVIQPIVVRKITAAVTDDNSEVRYELIAGERRWRACKLAHLHHIPAIVRNFSDEEALAIALIENIQRRDLNVMEESKCYKRLIDEFNITHEKLSKVTGRSRSHITNMLRLLNLHNEVQEMLLNGQLSMGHARALLSLPEELQKTLAVEIVVGNLTTNHVESKVAQLLSVMQNNLNNTNEVGENIVNKLPHIIDPDIGRLETTIADKLGMLVNIKHGRRGCGKVTISYASLDELDNLLRLF